MKIREIKPSDAENLANLIQRVEASSQYMLWEAGERVIQPENQLTMIERINSEDNSTILVSERDNQLIGYLFAMGGNAKRNKHAAYIVIGISEGYRGQGIGKLLFKQLENWAASNNIKRLELTVVTKNEPGLSLYKKAGFEVEGTKRKSLIIDGEFVDEYYMSKIL
ncbi:GNAT family N-acetyltransferase [Ornithinibacillus contaminans]|uniref:GNAT family N-acetyltransferase n=1 Tax=Ornithinibacillus contaminans TaxID=694055 RepID=UPI00064E05BA|nr:GNAT family N-acetyltransferase [Ornithinibacillus contaminans]